SPARPPQTSAGWQRHDTRCSHGSAGTWKHAGCSKRRQSPLWSARKSMLVSTKLSPWWVLDAIGSCACLSTIKAGCAPTRYRTFPDPRLFVYKLATSTQVLLIPSTKFAPLLAAQTHGFTLMARLVCGLRRHRGSRISPAASSLLFRGHLISTKGSQ